MVPLVEKSFIILVLYFITAGESMGKNNLSFFCAGDFESMGQSIKRASELDLVYYKCKAIFITRMSHTLSVHCLCSPHASPSPYY